MNRRLRALVLTAGFGTRLHPLTHFIPKPLLPVGRGPLVGATLESLATLGCDLAVLNLHHLGEQIPDALGKRWFGLRLDYSWEDPIQGTLGALAAARDTLSDTDAVLLVNGDSLCDWPWKALLRQHFRTQADATLLLHRRAPESVLGGGVGVGSGGAVVQIRDSDPTAEVVRRHLFAGAHILSPKLLERVPAEPGDIIEGLYLPMLAEGSRITGVVTRRRWHDLGTPDRYLAASLESLPAHGVLRRRTNAVSPLAEIAQGAEIRRSIIAAGAVVAADTRVSDSILLANSRVGAGCTIEGSILGPGVELPNATQVERRMVNRLTTSHPPGKHETVLGDLSYVPLSATD